MLSLILVWLAFVTNPQDAAARAEQVLAQLQAGDFAKIEAIFDDRMAAALPAGRLEAAWKALLTQAGAFKSCGAPRVQTAGELDVSVSPCEFAQARINAQVVFDKAGRIAGLSFRPAAAAYSPPPYATPSSYAETDVTIGSGEWALPGTLTTPVGDGPFPAVVLVHGSGPGDRDETIGAEKPFKDLAVGLASRGVAVLRYDKRTKVHPQKLAAVGAFTVQQEVLDDVVLAVAALRAQPRIDPARVFVLGHSLGGMLIPRIVPLVPKVAGAIVMAGAARPLEQAIVEQTKYLAGADGTVTPDEQARIADAEKLSAQVRALTPADASRTDMVSGAPPSVLARSARLRSARGRPRPADAAADPAGRTRLSGDDGRVRHVEGRARVEPVGDVPQLSGAEPPVHGGHGQESALGI